MIRDFEQVKGDVSCWLRHIKPMAKLTSRNPAGEFGRLRQSVDIQLDPMLCMQAFELKSIFGGSLMYAGVQVLPVSEESQGFATNMAWDGKITCFTSPILGNNMCPQRLESISGVFLDRLYAQIAFPVEKALRDLGVRQL